MNNQNEATAIDDIRAVIRAKGDEYRSRFPILAKQDVMGLGIFLFAVLGVGLSAWGYLSFGLPAWLCIVLVAFFTSLLHELEHDLIHWQYFKQHRWLHHTMLLVGWILRPGTINPWIRRHLHFLHHKVSGTPQDLEERGIGNGLAYGPLRLFIMLDTFTGNILRAIIQRPRGEKLKGVARIVLANFPFAVMTAILWYSFLGFHLLSFAADMAGVNMNWSVSTLGFFTSIEPLIVILIAPFYLRSFCLNFISSNMHYYGGVNSLLQQTQVLNHPVFWPFQLFCFNFGSTHSIHHFVVAEPFYIRQLTAKTAHAVMTKYGVRVNDLHTLLRSNHYDDHAAEQTMPS